MVSSNSRCNHNAHSSASVGEDVDKGELLHMLTGAAPMKIVLKVL